MSVAMGARDDDTLTSLANRLIRLDKVMTDKEKSGFKKICEESCITIAQNLLNAFDEDIINEKAQKEFGVTEPLDVTGSLYKDICTKLADIAAEPFNNPELREYIEDARKNHDQIIDNTNLDELTKSGWESEYAGKSEEIINTFEKFIQENKDNIDALEIIYSQSYRNRPLMLQAIQELHEALQKPPYRLTVEKLWGAYSTHCPEKVRGKSVVNQLADIISLVRFQLGQTSELNAFSADVARRFQQWTFDKQKGAFKFTEEQTEWLRMIRDHIATSMSITPEDLDFTPFDSKGGLGKFYQLFGNEYETILNEMNYALLEAA
jgi:type I restriction enzyme R subunit